MTNTQPIYPPILSKNKKARPCKPFIVYAGGKTSLLPEIFKKLPVRFNNYYEPFVGGGAVMFALAPKKAYISDVNHSLITAYNAVKEHFADLCDILLAFHKLHSANFFRKLRDTHFTSPIINSARLIYLAKASFGGLLSHTRSGRINSTLGTYRKKFYGHDIIACSNVLQNAHISRQDFDNIVPKKDDFVYFDPPYHSDNKAMYASYNPVKFTDDDHIRLATFCKKLHQKGVKFMVSNYGTPFIRDLFSDKIFKIHDVVVQRCVNGSGKVREILITNYPPCQTTLL